ncbi:putative short-chain dehydrogenase/reductase family 42E member 2 [Vombatus ursinus]|uniref:putative short-chain dehydrogenase/reductase family 42E member 2 n=1 Tax=Vombatus ursinus TaxID=29139 RepID=UPI000FFCE5CE|nr:putative short-chain dehydrogenase/reductase family 42E member 2 [Vombatus ursinus]XP_027730466.1 putative short-chain dehydrogenase/reductase family 42E member 2 [Vombatus ursinus]
MKPNPTNSSPHLCGAATLGEKSCPVCQAWRSGEGPGASCLDMAQPKAGGLTAPQGQAPQSQAPQGQAPQGQPPQGQAPQGQPPQGQAPQGQPPQGQAPQGQAPQGQAPQGQAPQGQPPQGQAPQSQPPQGQVPQGQAPQGQPPQGQAPQGQPREGQALQSQALNSKPKEQTEPPRPTSQKALVTGGGGYFGFNLGSSLVRRGVSVVLLDIQHPKWELPKGVAFIQGDIRDGEALYRACEGVDCVFHVASYGMSGAEKLHKEQIESVNIGGTKIVINVCIKRQIPRLVYTSTVNVVFGGKPIEQGDEDSVPYFPLEKHIDHYSRTKAIADQLILTSNGTPLPGGGTLRTCVLRPPGIYGPEEQRHLPRVAGSIRKRLFTFKFGDPRTRMNWVHVQNLVQAHLLAAEALTANKSYIASGQAYYINDGESVNLFEWMSPLFDKMGYSRPWIQIPTSLAYLAATGMEYFHLALKPICDFPPLLTRSEVWSIAVTHTFQIRKARDQLGYVPEKFTFADSVDHYIQTRHKRQHHSPGLLRFLMALICLLGALLLSLYLLDPSFLGLSHGNHM